MLFKEIVDARTDGRTHARTDDGRRTLKDHKSSLSTSCSGELKRDKLYTKLKRSCSHKRYYTEKFKHLKSTIQKQIRNAYWSYLESVVFAATQGPGHKKKFNNFVKHKKTENIGITELWRSNSLRSSVEHTQQTIWIRLFKAFATQPQTISKTFNV